MRALTIVKSQKKHYLPPKKSETVYNESDKNSKFCFSCCCYQRGKSGSIANKKQELNNNNKKNNIKHVITNVQNFKLKTQYRFSLILLLLSYCCIRYGYIGAKGVDPYYAHLFFLNVLNPFAILPYYDFDVTS